jgi:hypothetical protein
MGDQQAIEPSFGQAAAQLADAAKVVHTERINHKRQRLGIRDQGIVVLPQAISNRQSKASVNPIRRDANEYADAETNQRQRKSEDQLPV